ncbi:MAG: hypothetical protein DDT21_02025 [Syntrophomonadaceae bacterium]|nr:hypothetical protein [Bacillota bacterium]
MKRIAVFLFTLMFLCVGSGCVKNSSSYENNANVAVINLVVYLTDAAGEISAHKLSVNVSDSYIELSPEVLFKVSGELGWQNRIYPLNFSSRLLALPYAPLEQPAIKYTLAKEGELYNGDYVLIYDYTDQVMMATIRKGDTEIAVIALTPENMQLIPQAFFVDDEGNIAVLCNTKGETFDKVNPVSLLYTKKGGTYQFEKISDYSSIFDKYDLSKINMPNYVNIGTNIYGNPQSKTFLWNEGANIVEINPYNGTIRVVLTVSKIKTDMPNLDTHRDFYGFFTGLGYQNGIYIAGFPNYNNLPGTISVFYNKAGEFLGSVLCTENYISVSNKDNVEKSRIDNIKLNSKIFIPQGTLY